jgi:hypothetical protein
MLAELLALAVVSTGTVPSAAVTVESSPPTVSVRLTRPASLGAVIESLCEKTQARCDGLPTVSFWPTVSPREVSGSWEFVVGELMSGSGVGYAVVPPSAGREAQLIIQGRSDPAEPTIREPHDSAPAVASGDSTHDLESAEPSEEPRPADAAPTTSADEQATEVPSANAAAAGVPAASMSPLLAPATGTTGAAALAMTPFATPGGAPLVVPLAPPGTEATTGWVDTPFSDENGAPLTIPFAPETNPVAPFSGPDGQPIPIEVQPQAPKLEYPIPPTPVPAPKKHE